MICGDFNSIFSPSDKSNGTFNCEDIRLAQGLVADLHLLEPPFFGKRFTWTNGQASPIWVKLDRFLVNSRWVEFFPRVTQNCLPRLGSDHVPIRLESGLHIPKPRPFRFEQAWCLADNFFDLIKDWWNLPQPSGCGAFILAKKIKHLKEKLKTWAREDFGSIRLKKLALLHDIGLLDNLKESRSLTDEETHKENDLRAEMYGILKQEEIYWKQRARVTWLKEGDENTSYFHSVANGRKNQNFINRIRQGGQVVEDSHRMGNFFTSYYNDLFGSIQDHRSQINWCHLLGPKAQNDLTMLDSPFTHEEIRAAVFGMHADKAPGPDGFPIFFFQKFWDIIKFDIFKLCEDFYNGITDLERINWANIALIPKCQTPEDPSHYRPISLINSTLKIVSKVLANRLSGLIDGLVDSTQSAFIRGRCIIDNISTAQELIFFMQKFRLPGLILKVDFTKVFDTVDWKFLLDLLTARGFSAKWTGWISSILLSSKASLIINGTQCGYVRYCRGLRQGDPLSPLLFVLVMDVLSTMFNAALSFGILKGVVLGETRGKMCHLQFADDLVVMTTGGGEDLRIIKLILYLFEGLSGLKVNLNKTCLYSSQKNIEIQTHLARTMHCQRDILPLTYLGIPISGCRPRRQDWEILISKVRNRLATWKSKLLSLGGRLTLVNSVLSAIPTYWMSIFKLPC